MPVRPENVKAIAERLKWRVVLADLFCIAALVVALFAVSRTDLYYTALILLGIGITMAVLAVAER